MGMSASQARLIALTARMNDIEYQGQQINQQRTTLSSQVNALYNTLLEMDVPTPPSPIDFQKTVYSGITGATRFTMSNVVPTGKNLAGNNTYSIDLAYQMTGHSVSPSATSAQVTMASEFLYYLEVDQSAYMNNPSPRFEVPTQQDLLSNLAVDDPNDSTVNDVLVCMQASQYSGLCTGLTPSEIYTVDGQNGLKEIQASEISNLDPSASIYVQLNSEDIINSPALCQHCGNLTMVDIDNDSAWDIANGNYDLGSATLTNVYSASLTTAPPVYQSFNTTAQIINANLYAVDQTNNEYYRIMSKDELEDYLGNPSMRICKPGSSEHCDFQINNPNYNPDARNTGYTVGNMVVYNMNDPQVITQLGQASYDDYIEGLHNSFPAFEGEDIADKFYVYIEFTSSGTVKPHFILKSDLGSINKDVMAAKVYDYDEDGTYTANKKTPDCELEFDVATGRISKLGIPDGNGQIVWVEITAATETDQVAYNIAFNDYEYEKIKYDKEQQLINQKTSIIQAEDKSLELKLTRLDNERNAVNTEIEAVKKVVDDNIQKSFKTFAG